MSASLSERFLSTDSGVLGGLMLHFGIDLGAK
jgi:hypothetical protein